VTYDCDNPAAGIHIPKAFQGVQTTASVQQTFYSERNGQVSGTVSLSPTSAAAAMRCPPSQQSGNALVGGWQAVNVVIEGASGITISAPPRLPTLTF
jgi:hypothetical protein